MKLIMSHLISRSVSII